VEQNRQGKSVASGTSRPRRETRFFALDLAPSHTINTGQIFCPSLQLVGEKVVVVSKKRHFSTDFTRVSSDSRVEPYSNDRGCHRLLLTRDSSTSPSSEYVNMWNQIDREVYLNRI
jgi:hypothetical protein